jgi:type VI secretion system protein ImpK
VSSDPFAEPGDSEATVFRPRPSAAVAAQPAFASSPPTRRGPAQVIPRVGDNPLVAAAAPVLAAAIRISSDLNPPDPDRLRTAMVAAIQRFETDALATGLDTRSLRAARYALCATVDDLVLSTPWGTQSSWVQHSLTSVFHNEVIGGERFFDILERMQSDLGNNAQVVELMYLCTSLGFEGRYRVMPRGVAALTELREGVYRLLRQIKGDFERELSPHWRGVAMRARGIIRHIPIWARILATACIAGVCYLTFSFILAGVSDSAFAELADLPPSQPLAVARQQVRITRPPPTPAAVVVPASRAARFREFLAPEIRSGLVQVFEDQQAITIRLANRNMFGSGEAVLGANYPALLVRIGDALETEPGQVTVLGFTDNQAIRTARFPSNFELSRARAETVANALKARLKKPERVKAEGKGESNPVAANATPEGRQQNRRTEIVLTKPADGI